MSATLKKLETLCKPLGVEFDAQKNGFDGWHIIFNAMPFHVWNSSTATTSVFTGETLRGVIGFLRSEIACGFYKLDPSDPDDRQTLLVTGQIED